MGSFSCLNKYATALSMYGVYCLDQVGDIAVPVNVLYTAQIRTIYMQ